MPAADNAHLEDTALNIRPLDGRDAPRLAVLIADYAQSVRRGPKRPADLFYAETLLDEGSHTVLGALIGEALVGFAIYTEFPDPIAGLKAGAIHHLYTDPELDGQGLDQAIVDVIADEASNRKWTELVIIARREETALRRLGESMGAPDGSARFIVALSGDRWPATGV
ncbi:MAG: GNAT family N-acetyltransferase [Pseudomonadota bacterium]